MFDNISHLKIMSLLCLNQKIKLIVMQKKYVELKNNRVAILKYNFGVDTETELFKELSENAIIPIDLYLEPTVEVLLLSENNNAMVNKMSKDDIKTIYEAICGLKPNKMTVAEYF